MGDARQYADAASSGTSEGAAGAGTAQAGGRRRGQVSAQPQTQRSRPGSQEPAARSNPTPATKPAARKRVMRDFGIFGDLLVLEEVNGMWASYLTEVKKAKEIGVHNATITAPMFNLVKDKALGRKVKYESLQTARDTILTRLEKDGIVGKEADDINKTIMDRLQSLVANTGMKQFYTKTSLRADGRNGDVTVDEYILPGLTRHTKALRNKEGELTGETDVFWSYESQHPTNADEIGKVVLSANYAGRGFGGAVVGVPVTAPFRDAIQQGTIKDLDTKPSERSRLYVDYLRNVASGLAVGQIIPYDLALALLEATALRKGKSLIAKTKKGVPSKKPLPFFMFQEGVEIRRPDVVHMLNRLLDLDERHGKLELSGAHEEAPPTIVGDWMFWRLVGKEKETETAAEKQERQRLVVAGRKEKQAALIAANGGQPLRQRPAKRANAAANATFY